MRHTFGLSIDIYKGQIDDFTNEAGEVVDGVIVTICYDNDFYIEGIEIHKNDSYLKDSYFIDCIKNGTIHVPNL
jgi:hypothetical protein